MFIILFLKISIFIFFSYFYYSYNMTKELASTTVDVADGIISAPVIGHVIGGTQYVVSKITDDDELSQKGTQRMNRANRSTWVIGGAFVGLPAGPVGAIAGATIIFKHNLLAKN